MKHPDKCDCPIHIVEDTTNVKIAAWTVITVAILIALFSA